mmetsp:Transcript_30396/g.80803  ORF Transcript_30396/g.80803 Transcript_30396/m.80803 type:complete len:85 (-) Transcript_30396:14-268(-)
MCVVFEDLVQLKRRCRCLRLYPAGEAEWQGQGSAGTRELGETSDGMPLAGSSFQGTEKCCACLGMLFRERRLYDEMGGRLRVPS